MHLHDRTSEAAAGAAAEVKRENLGLHGTDSEEVAAGAKIEAIIHRNHGGRRCEGRIDTCAKTKAGHISGSAESPEGKSGPQDHITRPTTALDSKEVWSGHHMWIDIT